MNEHQLHKQRGTEESCFSCMTNRAKRAEGQLKSVERRHQHLLQQVAEMAQSAREKDRRLTALHWVWCTGGCHDQTEPLTEEIVQTAERAVQRMRTKLANTRAREARARETLTVEKLNGAAARLRQEPTGLDAAIKQFQERLRRDGFDPSVTILLPEPWRE